MLAASMALAVASVLLGTARPHRTRALREAAAGPLGRPGSSRARWLGNVMVVTVVATAVWAAVAATAPSATGADASVPLLSDLLPGPSGTPLAAAAVLALSGLAFARSAEVSRRARQAARRRQAVVGFGEALVGELRAGQPVTVALERSVEAWPEVAAVVAAARVDADLPAALRRLAELPGAEALSHLASAWQLCATTGGGLASAVAQVLETARADAAALRQVEGEVASARATARLVAGLPVVVLIAGQGLGAHPWAFLLGHPLGVACLAGGLLLVHVGLAWIDHIAASATGAEG